MAKRKIAITIPPDTLERVDSWAERLNVSRSQFILDQVENSLRNLEDDEVTQHYNEAYATPEALEENRTLAQDMRNLAPQDQEKW